MSEIRISLMDILDEEEIPPAIRPVINQFKVKVPLYYHEEPQTRDHPGHREIDLSDDRTPTLYFRRGGKHLETFPDELEDKLREWVRENADDVIDRLKRQHEQAKAGL